MSKEEKNTSESSKNSSSIKNLLKNPTYLIYVVLGLIIIGLVIIILTTQKKETVEITSFTPMGEVQQTTNFTMEFSKELVGDPLLNVQLEKVPIEFEPPIQGNVSWVARNKIRFSLDVLLFPSPEYTAEISPGVASEHGFFLKGIGEYNFHTPRFRVNSALLTFEFTPRAYDKVKFLSTIEFNYEVDPEAAVKSISIQSKEGKRFPFQLITTSPNKILTLEAENVERGEEEQQIKLVIAGGLKCVGGNLGLERDFVNPLILS